MLCTLIYITLIPNIVTYDRILSSDCTAKGATILWLIIGNIIWPQTEIEGQQKSY